MEPIWPAAYAAEVVRPFLRNLSVSIVALEAWRRGFQVTLLDGGPRQVLIEDHNGRSVRFFNSRPEMSTIEGVRLARNKHETTSLLANKGFPTPATRLVNAHETTRADIVRIATEIGFPVVLKPSSGSKGTGVFTGITGDSELLSYYDHLINDIDVNQVVVESHEDGEMDLRVLVIGSHVVGIIHRVPANITGDGEHSVSELIDAKNIDRSCNPFLRSGLIKKDQEVSNYVSAAGHTMTSIPEKGEYLRLRGKSNGSAGGDTSEVSHLISEKICDDMVKVVQSFPGLYAAGVDILYTPERGSTPEKYTLIEVNATPQIALNMYPMHGPGKESPRVWIDTCFPGSGRSDVPGEEKLTFSLEEPLEAIRTGSANRVTLEPIPTNRLPERKRFTFDTNVQLREASRRRLLRQARTHGVSGSLTRNGDQMVLHVAGELATNVEDFVEKTSAALQTRAVPAGQWRSVVRTGFRFQ